MRLRIRSVELLLLLVGCAMTHAGTTRGATNAAASAQDYPAKPVQIIEPFGAGAYSAAISKNLPYDPLKGFIPIASLTNQPYVLVAGNPAGITTVRELIAAAKTKPGELEFGPTGAVVESIRVRHHAPGADCWARAISGP